MKYIKTFDLGLDAGIKEFKEEIHQKAYLKYLEEVKNNGWNLKDVPEEFKTLELCKYAIEDCLKWNDNLLRKYEFENLFEKYVPVEVQEELAEKYDIELPDKDKGR